ncbi:hypothetical protein [Pseudomonas azotoformans]|uniref:hypothetical protein n=1 Tax=Pseudomonas azotoformans TaxID=47878 RepID=UPI001146A297|nr:hypothetical protein [Pseudomonas azotoformans]QDH64148.1 hypothetical protein FKZ69_09050 [Pseudomonas azotoformans]
MSVIYAVFNDDGLFQQMLISGVHAIPDGAVRLSDDLSTRILQQPDSIWRIDESGAITSTEPESTPPTREQIEALRLRSYADPLSGSDRYFAEAQRMQVMNEPGWEAVRAAGVARFEEIQTQFPWTPVDDTL